MMACRAEILNTLVNSMTTVNIRMVLAFDPRLIYTKFEISSEQFFRRQMTKIILMKGLTSKPGNRDS